MATLTETGVAVRLRELGMAGPQVNTGDLIVGDSSIAPLEAKKVTIGADDEVLVVDSSTGTGLDWKSISEVPQPTQSVTGNTTLTVADRYVNVDAKAGAITITLPSISGIDGREYTIKKIDSTANIVTVSGSQAIDNENTQLISAQFSALKIISMSNLWWIV